MDERLRSADVVVVGAGHNGLVCAAYLATMGISAALLARLHTGRGQHVETSLLQAAMTVTATRRVSPRQVLGSMMCE